MKTISLADARKLYKTDKNFQAVCDFLASYKRGRWIVKAGDLPYDVAVTYGEAVAVLRSFEELGFGRFVVGRHGKATRFEWNRRPVAVMKAIRGESNELPGSIYEDDLADSEFQEGEAATIVDRYQLRVDFEVKVLLPSDISKDEAARLAEHLRTMYFRS